MGFSAIPFRYYDIYNGKIAAWLFRYPVSSQFSSTWKDSFCVLKRNEKEQISRKRKRMREKKWERKSPSLHQRHVALWHALKIKNLFKIDCKEEKFPQFLSSLPHQVRLSEGQMGRWQRRRRRWRRRRRRRWRREMAKDLDLDPEGESWAKRRKKKCLKQPPKTPSMIKMRLDLRVRCAK